MADSKKGLAYEPIADYGIIGDCHSAALVSKNGSIDWYCPERFDTPAIFCRLLDSNRGGFFSLVPEGGFSVQRRYLENTNILETVIKANESKIRITDFMPVHQRTESPRGHDVGTSRRILRRVDGLAGKGELGIIFHPTFDYARGQTLLEVEEGSVAVARHDGHYLSLASTGTGLEYQSRGPGGISGRLSVQEGDRRWLVLTEAGDPDRVRELPSPGQCEQQMERTQDYWRRWARRCTYRGPYRAQVLRSALTLKLLTYEPTGAIIAAPTTSLPEEIGGVRNWDYRYAWVRDSVLIIYALMNIGYRQEASDFFEWLQETHQNDPSPDLQVLYGIDGRRDLTESNLDNLEGYAKSRPVRIGNAAAGQFQLDIYGEALASAYLYFASGIGNREGEADAPRDRERKLEHDWAFLRSMVERAARRWSEPDNGIWEVRGSPKRFLYSRLMCWTALDRGIRLSREFSLEAPLDRWVESERLVRQAILTDGFNQKIGAFTQAFGSNDLDASALLIPRVGFLSATDPRVQSTVNLIKTNLTHDGMVYRYRTSDGLSGDEGKFITCAFWMVDALAMCGRLDEAHELFERLSGFDNDIGLYSEEIGAFDHEMLGNFPQGFTHMAQINAAINLAKINKHGSEVLPETEAERAKRAGPAAAEGYNR